MIKIALHNLGCKVNSYEIEVMQQRLVDKGYKIVPFDEKADVYIVNTCTVTNIADRKSRQMLHRAKQLNPQAVVVAVGCYVQTGQDEIQKDAGIDLAIGNNRKKDIVEILEAYLEEHGKLGQAADKTLNGSTILNMDIEDTYEEMKLERTGDHTRAYIKIQDGCNQFCTYCAIPLARGRVRSRRAEDVLEEIKGMVAAGYKEVVLTGIHISSYGIDFDGDEWARGNSVEKHRGERLDYSGESRLLDLVEKLQEIPGLERIRLGSLEPRVVTREAAFRLASFPKVCPHFHLSLQSGCDTVLKRMNRHYTTEEYMASVNYLREAYDRPAITTDVIVGFPGETEEEFAQTVKYLEEICFYEMHVFKYSKRAGTRAAVMPGQLTEKEKTARSAVLLKMEKEQSKEFRAKYLGQKAQVLLEEEVEINGKKYRIGHTKDYVKVAVDSEIFHENNRIVEIPVSGFLTDDILM